MVLICVDAIDPNTGFATLTGVKCYALLMPHQTNYIRPAQCRPLSFTLGPSHAMLAKYQWQVPYE